MGRGDDEMRRWERRRRSMARVLAALASPECESVLQELGDATWNSSVIRNILFCSPSI